MKLPVVRMMNTAISILRNDGPTELARAISRSLFKLLSFLNIVSPDSPQLDSPDEVGIVYQVLQVGNRRGTMIDVGAHYGSAFRRFALSGWRVYAFEPDSLNRQRLMERGYGKMPNVKIDPRGVSNEMSTETPFYRSKESTGISGLSAFHPTHVLSEKVEVTTLELFVEEQGIDSIDFLKIDTEGFDLLVLKGFPWEEIRPDIILCEFEDKKTVPLGCRYHDMAKYLEALGYKVIVSEWYPIERYGVRHNWRRFAPYPCELVNPNAWGNIFAVNAQLYSPLVTACRLD